MTLQSLRKILKLLILIILFQVFSKGQQVYATHAAGSDLTYRCLGGNQYEINVSFYRDCAGIAEPSVITVYYRSVSCGFNLNVTATQIPNSEVEISMPCSSAASTCNNGTVTGIKKFRYSAVVNLPVACSDWVFSYSICCRNCSITTINDPCGSGSNLYVEAKLNNLVAPGNNSPSFSNNPIAFVCVGQNFNFNQGVYDADGDSISYSLIAPKTGAATSVQFLPPASITAPIASSTPFSLNPVTGDINFTPSQIQIGILAVLVEEFRNGQLIGSVIRDIQIYSSVCNNDLPTASGINGTNNYSMTVCPGQSLCFDILTNDNDPNQNVVMTTNNGITGGTFTISGGTRPTGTFCWTPGFNDVDLLPKTFTVTVTDNNCPSEGQQTFSYSIFVPSPFFTFSTTQVTCNGGNNGSASASPVYGNLYNYSWNTVPPQTTTSVTGLTAGTYILTVSDTNSCSLSVPVEISQPAPIQINSNISNASCSGICNGSIDLISSNGSPVYSYLWSNGSSTEDLSGLCSGTYTVTVSDQNGCSIEANYIVAEGLTLSAIIDGTDVSCFGNADGVANLSLTGGVQPVSYLWSNGETTEDISGLTPGVYTVIVLDAGFCSSSASVIISQPDVLSSASTVANVTCNNAADGLIDLSVYGGTLPYAFLWSNSGNTEDQSGLSPGTYEVQVTDLYGCSLTKSFVINEPDEMLVQSSVTNVSCFGASNGSIDLTFSGGTFPYSFIWSDGSVSDNISNVTSGTYAVTITDAHQCELTNNYTINQPPALGLSFSSQSAVCTSANGSAEVMVSGGTPGYGYLWSNGETSSLITGLNPGVYTVTVTDNLLCQFSDTVSVPLISQNLNLAFTSVSTNCSSSTDGSIDLSVSGGTEPYSFLWSDGNISEDLLLVGGGIYDVVVTDANGCTQSGTSEIESPDPLISTINIVDISCNVVKGTIDLQVTGGIAPYTFSWSGGETSEDLYNLDPGAFTVVYTDLNGCTGTNSATVIQIPDLILTAESGNTSGQGASDGNIDLTINGGLAPFSYLWSNGESVEDLLNLSGGIYVVTVTDALGCSASLSVEVYDNIASSVVENSDDVNIQVFATDNGNYTLGVKPSLAGNYSILLFDYSGRIVMDVYNGMLKSGINEMIPVDCSKLSGGIYLMKVSSEKNMKTVKMYIPK